MIVVDANVILAALRSSRGASHHLIRTMLYGAVPYAVSPAIALEYEDVLKRPGLLGDDPWISADEIDTFLDGVISQAYLVSPWFRFRPFLVDPKDDAYIECALAAGATYIVSNDRHFRHPDVLAFGLTLMNASEFLSATSKRSD